MPKSKPYSRGIIRRTPEGTYIGEVNYAYKRYRNLATKADAKAYFKIAPLKRLLRRKTLDYSSDFCPETS